VDLDIRSLSLFLFFRLSNCKLSERSCKALAEILSCESCSLRELGLSNNDLGDLGLKHLCVGLENPKCPLETLRSVQRKALTFVLSYGDKLLARNFTRNFFVCSLSGCGITKEGCTLLASALNSNPSHLKELDLSYNHPGTEGVKLLTPILDTLRLSNCKLSERSCKALAEILICESCSLRELDLSNNDLGDLGLKHLCDGLENPNCTLETLSLSGCGITEEGCAFLVSALNSNPSRLKELDLSYNHPGTEGVELLTPKLDTLRLSNCKLSERSCKALAEILSCESCSLRELDLSNNDLGNLGLKHLCVGLENPNCTLETLRLVSGSPVRSCKALAEILICESCSLRELDLSNNDLGDLGLKHLCVGLENPNCTLETLRSVQRKTVILVLDHLKAMSRF
uniref:NACHT LRR and PYD domain-containing protein n=1 Tax=Oryzias melastigma TaxID=30732 RepID=A0A3B3CDE8_ORYME